MLEHLPHELFLQILSEGLDWGDLSKLSLVSRELRRHAIPELFESIALIAPNKRNNDDLADLGVESFLATIPQAYLEYVRHVTLRSTLSQLIRSTVSQLGNTPADLVASMAARQYQLMHFLKLIPNDRLITFRWEVGLRIPDPVLQHITTSQRNVRTLSVARSYDSYEHDGECSFELLQLTQLKGFRFVGSHLSELDAVFGILRLNAPILHKIEVDWDVVGGISGVQFPLERLTLGECSTTFPSLRRLSLAGFSFTPASLKGVVVAFNFPHLRSLTLKNCPNADGLLEMLSRYSKPLQLVSFSLKVTPDCCIGFNHRSLSHFLDSHEGLRDLSLLYGNPFVSNNVYDMVWPSIWRHRSTLERLLVDDFPCVQPVNAASRLSRLLEYNNLQYLGANFSTMLPLPVLRQMDPRPRCKFLHVRAGWRWNEAYYAFCDTPNGPPLDSIGNIRAFADWAFGLDGLPELEVLAYGVFPMHDRMPNYLLCRANGESHSQQSGPYWQFYETSIAEARWLSIVRDNADLLSAGAADALLYDGFESQ